LIAYLERYLDHAVEQDLARKMVFIGGPRQSGKTTLARQALKRAGENPTVRYLNWDVLENRRTIMEERFPAGDGLLVLDEVQKYSRWRQTVKGLFDSRGPELRILVTGSAKLDYYRRGGDSLQGRYHFYRLFPLSLAELKSQSHNDLMDLYTYGGFPEPFLLASETESRRWTREYHSRLVRQDLSGLERLHDISLVERLAMRLPDLVGAPLSLNSLREDLQVSHQSVSRWVDMLENLYMLFRIYPFGAAKIRAVKKESKHYHFDWTVVKNPGGRFENMIACHLHKWCCFLQDSQGRNIELRYFRDIDKREVDFVIVEDLKPVGFIECKLNGKELHSGLRYLTERFPEVPAVQLVLGEKVDVITKERIRICSAEHYLKDLV